MRLRLLVFAATIAAVCSVATSSYGQYPIIPGYRMPNQPAALPPGMVPGGGPFGQPMFVPGAAIQPAPVMQAVPVYSAPPSTGHVASTGHVSSAGFITGGPSCEVSCVSGGCDGRCGGTCSDCCMSGGFIGCWNFFGEFLYMRPRDAEVAWATPIDGPIVPGPINNNPIQIGRYGVVDMEYQPGWRGGLQYNFSECSAVAARYTMFESSTNNTVEVFVPNVVRSLVSHPGTQTAAQDFLTGTATYNIDYDTLDLDYRKLLSYDCNYQFGYLTGVTIVQMNQNFTADFAGTGTEHVDTDIDFYGAGGRFGLFGEAQVACNWRIYGRGTGNLVAGEFRADYNQSQSYDPQVVAAHWQAGRIVGIWDFEAGISRSSRCGNYAVSFGYMFSAWTNTVQTDDWIQGVRNNSVIGMDSTMTFDGLVARFDARF